MKRKLTLSVDDMVVGLAKENKVNLSDFLEKKLCEHFNVEFVNGLITKR